MNPVGAYAYRALDNVIQAQNQPSGEVKGIAPAWACDQHGEPGHNYFTCRDCITNFMKRPA